MKAVEEQNKLLEEKNVQDEVREKVKVAIKKKKLKEERNN